MRLALPALTALAAAALAAPLAAQPAGEAAAPPAANEAAEAAPPAGYGDAGPPRDPGANGFSSTDIMMAMQRGISPLPPEELAARLAWASAYPLGSTNNPVRAEMPEGERAYLMRLRCEDGSRPQIGQRHNVGMGLYVSIVDVYPLDCGDVAPGAVEVHMDMYHAGHVENEAPPGFRILIPE